MLRMLTEEEKIRAETAALKELAGVARNDPDWAIYWPGTERPRLSWWCRLWRTLNS